MKNSTNNRTATAIVKKQIERALKLRDDGKSTEAVRILTKLAVAKPEMASVHGLLADLYWRQGQLNKAIASFRKTTKLSPSSELASLGLFHALWEAGNIQQAKAEMSRFLESHPSEEYALIARDMNRDLAEKDSGKNKRLSDIRRYFQQLFDRRPELVRAKSNDGLLFLWLKENPDDQAFLPDAKRILAGVKKWRRQKSEKLQAKSR